MSVNAIVPSGNVFDTRLNDISGAPGAEAAGAGLLASSGCIPGIVSAAPEAGGLRHEGSMNGAVGTAVRGHGPL
jgi:hypothetical protein